MTRTPQALVEPELIRWARDSADCSLADAARRAGVTPERLGAWESGSEAPTIAQLRKLGEIYKRPLAVFFLPEPPQGFDAAREFRRLAGIEISDDISQALRSEIRRIVELREAAVDLIEEGDPEETPQSFDIQVEPTENPEASATRIREWLGVSLDQQEEWEDPYEALRGWRAAVEERGILVVQVSGVVMAEMRGFSIPALPVPVIALNSKDKPNGRIFTLLHELVHILHHAGAFCDLEATEMASSKYNPVEVFCNRVAGAIAIPPDALLRDQRIAHTPGHVDWTESTLGALSRRFSISREVVLRRLVILGRATEEFYRVKREQYLQEYAEEEKRASESDRKIRVPWEKRVVNAHGSAFVGLVFDSYYARRLTLNDVSTLLGVRLKHLPAVEREALGWSRVSVAG